MKRIDMSLLNSVVSELEKNESVKLINFEISKNVAKIQATPIPNKITDTIESYHKIGSDITLSYRGKLSTSGTGDSVLTTEQMHQASKLVEKHNVPIRNIFLYDQIRDFYISGEPDWVHISGKGEDGKINGEDLRKIIAPFVPENEDNKFTCHYKNMAISTKTKNGEFDGYSLAIKIANGLVDNNDFNVTDLNNDYATRRRYVGQDDIIDIINSPLKNLLNINIDDILNTKIKSESYANIDFRENVVNIKSPLDSLPRAVSAIYHPEK